MKGDGVDDCRLILGDCLDVLPTFEAGSIDACICDPPYPEIDRPYGCMTESEWAEMMHALVPEVRRVLKPTGSAVFVLQPNSRAVGSMRPWLFKFQAWVCETWNMVQDAWWWNPSTLPTVHCQRERGLMRGSVKACVWCGPPDCYRNQDAVLIEPAEATKADKRVDDPRLKRYHSGHGMRHARGIQTCLARGGATPFNLLVLNKDGGSGNGHGAATPLDLCSWWVRYICPPGGTVLDPFSGSGTVGVAALKLGRSYVGIERDLSYHCIARRRLAEVDGPLFAQAPEGGMSP